MDRTKVSLIRDITPDTEYIQVAGRMESIQQIGKGRTGRLTAELRDSSGKLKLVWFQGVNWIQKSLKEGAEYLIYGKVGYFNGEAQITHPEMELRSNEKQEGKIFLEPVYPSTEKLRARGLGGRQIGKLTYTLFSLLKEKDIPENLPTSLLKKLKFPDRYSSFRQIHFPSDDNEFQQALRRLKFEEFFLAQLKMGLVKSERHRFSKGVKFEQVGDLFNTFYQHHLPFQLTGAQKRVL